MINVSVTQDVEVKFVYSAIYDHRFVYNEYGVDEADPLLLLVASGACRSRPMMHECTEQNGCEWNGLQLRGRDHNITELVLNRPHVTSAFAKHTAMKLKLAERLVG